MTKKRPKLHWAILRNKQYVCYNTHMANDVILIKAIARKLNSCLTRGKIIKIHQPYEHEVVFTIAVNGEEKLLKMTAHGENNLIEIVENGGENPISAPNFTMILRKYLKNARIENIEVFNEDRVVLFTLRSKNELRDNTIFKLYFEAFGRFGNIVLTDQNDIILDALKRIGLGMSQRVILPNIKYPVQQHTKTSLYNLDEITNILNNAAIATDITDKISGISKDTAVEICQSSSKIDRLIELMNLDGNQGYIYENDGKFVLTPTKYYSLKAPIMEFQNILEAVAYFYKDKSDKDNKQKATKEHCKLLKQLKNKYERMYKASSAILEKASDNDMYRLYGETILCNTYKINKGDTQLLATDYASNNEISISLDPLKNAKENAENYFKKYKKGKKAIEIATLQYGEAKEILYYLEQISANIMLCEKKAELDEVLAELYKLSGKKKTADKRQKTQKPSPIMTIQYKGFSIFVGKNNQQNDRLTFEVAKSNDIWLHVKNFHGSHVIISAENKNVPEDVILRGAELAAFYSTASEMTKVDVDYTERRNVKRQGKLMGMVNYKNYKTITVKPCA